MRQPASWSHVADNVVFYSELPVLQLSLKKGLFQRSRIKNSRITTDEQSGHHFVVTMTTQQRLAPSIIFLPFIKSLLM